MRAILAALALFWAAAAPAQDARRIVEPLDPAIIDNATIAAVTVKPGPTAAEAVTHFDTVAAERLAKAVAARKPVPQEGQRPPKGQYGLLPFDRMFPLVMEDTAREFSLDGDRRINLAVTLDTIKQPNAAMAIISTSEEEIAGMVEVTDAADGRPLGMFHIDVINSYGMGFGLDALGRGPPREFLAREFARETVRVLAGRKTRTPAKAGR